MRRFKLAVAAAVPFFLVSACKSTSDTADRVQSAAASAAQGAASTATSLVNVNLTMCSTISRST